MLFRSSASGYRTGLYTSPHLVDFRERIRIGDELIDKDFIVDFINDLKEEIDKEGYTFFEVTTALAFSCFAKNKVDIAVLETGMGGRLDATNIVTPLISIITNISLEHTEHLGTTLPQIAFEKAGITKNKVPTITSVDEPEILQIIKNVCAERKSPLSVVNKDLNIKIYRFSIDQTVFDFGRYKNLKLNLSGKHQVTNAGLAIFAIEKLKEMGWKIKTKTVRNGLKDVNWRDRKSVV